MSEYDRPDDATDPQPAHPRPPGAVHEAAPGMAHAAAPAAAPGPAPAAAPGPPAPAGPPTWLPLPGSVLPPGSVPPGSVPPGSVPPGAGPHLGPEPRTQPFPPGPYGHPGPFPPGPPVQQAPRSGGGAGRVLALLLGAALIALCSGLAGGFVEHRLDSNGATSPSRPRSAAPVVDRSSLAAIADRVQPSVVDINTGQGEGSGVILTADGAILTNNHVVATATGSSLQVTFSDGKTARATIVGTDPAGDLAVIKAQGVSGLAAAEFGNSDDLRVGDTVLALGSPLGLQGSVTAGIVSALHRTIGEGAGTGGRRSIGDAIQTDAAINPGNSGGALVNTSGQVVGINTAIATSGQGEGNIGVGFAIASNRAKSTSDQLVKGGKVSHPILGVQVNDVDGGGALIADVTAGGPADKAGLKKGDVVVKAGSRNITNSSDLVAAVQAGKPGDQLTLTVRNGTADRQVTVTLGEA